MKELTLECGKRNFAALQWGNEDQPLVLALHGWLDNAASFQPVGEKLSGYRLIAVDLAGHGHSPHRSDDAHYHFIDYVQDLFQLCESQNWENFYLLGHSMGGIIATLFTAAFPEKVKKLISIESAGPLTKAENTTVEQIRTSVESRARIKDKPMRVHQSLDSAISARANAGDISVEIADILVRRNIHDSDNGYLWRTDQRLRTLSSLRMTEVQAQEIFKNISVETLLIEGEQGYKEMKALINQRFEWLSQGKRVVLPGGHHLHMEHPELVVEEISAFFK